MNSGKPSRTARAAAAGGTLLLAVVCLGAQESAPKAEIQAVVGSDGAHAGTSVRVALEVALPEGVHVQADRPRDPFLIPTTLTVDAPPGVTVTEVVYPESTDFVQVGQKEPLAVFERRFIVGARLSVDATVAVGEIVVPARLRYQACNASICFAPTRAEIRWILRVVPADTPTTSQHESIFERIRFGR